MGTTPDQLKTEIDETRGELTTNVNALADKVSPARITRRRLQAVKETATGVKDKVIGTAGETTSSATSSVGDGASSVAQTIGDTPSTVARRTQGNPLPVALIAFGAGALVASLLPETGAETRMAESMAAGGVDVIGATKNAAAESAQRLKESMTPRAQQALASVKENAAEAVDTTKSQAQGAASDVASHGERAAKQVRGKAQTAKAKTTATAKKSTARKPSDVHVVHKNGTWVVEQKGAGVVSTHRTQALAEQAGRRLARREKTEFVLHATNGRIREKDSYGNDPRGRG